jgi:hypothetical protein
LRAPGCRERPQGGQPARRRAEPRRDPGASSIGRTISPGRLRAGRILSGLAVAFLVFDAAGKLMKVAPVIEGSLALRNPRLLALLMDGR